MKSGSRQILAGAALVAAIAAAPAAAQADTVRLMTGPQGGVWVPLGGALKDMWEKAVPGMTRADAAGRRHRQRARDRRGQGRDRLRQLDLDRRRRSTASSRSPRKATNVCNLATLYPQYFQVVVTADSGINSIKDLKGKSIAVQTRGNTAEMITQHILQVQRPQLHRHQGELPASYTDSVSLMKDGHAQAFTLGTTIPAVVGHGPRLGARRQAARPVADSLEPMQQDQPRLHAGDDQGEHLSEAGQGRAR